VELVGILSALGDSGFLRSAVLGVVFFLVVMDHRRVSVLWDWRNRQIGAQDAVKNVQTESETF
jgi:hypothetical protein